MSVSAGLHGPVPGAPCRAPGEITFIQPATATERLNARVLDSFRRIAVAEARVVVAEARLVARLFDVDGHRRLGFATFGDCARETLGVSPRHAADRRMLDRLFRERPNIERAFLDGRVSACQALALRSVITDENEEMWIEICPNVTVSELKRAIREMKAPAMLAEPDDEKPFRTILFSAPPSVSVAFDQAMETARRVLGESAPRYRCVEAILAEVVPELAPVGDEELMSPRRMRPPAGGAKESVPFRVRPGVRVTLDLIDRELEDIEDLIEERDRRDPAAIVNQIRALQIVARPLRYLAGRLLDEVRDPGRLSLGEFAERHLRVSEATARNLLDETRLFEDVTIAEAWGAGRIGIGQAMLIGRVASADRKDAWIQRAERVTHRQFQREAAVFGRLQDFFPILAARHPGPMPDRGLEAMLLGELALRGWTPREIRDEMRRAGGGLYAAGPVADPAEDPATMRRLEILLEMLIVTAFDTVPTPQTFANAGQPVKTIRFRAPEPVARWWRKAIQHMEHERPGLPDWACVVLLIREAVEQWESEAGQARMAERPILERDGYLCQAPGCTRRKNLQVHHIRFRSQGGTNHGENKVTLCFVHHQILLHETGALEVLGSAPGNLTWTLGGAWRLRGEITVGGSARWDNADTLRLMNSEEESS